ncbi:MAG: hypothetical protein Q9222_004291 [Ikaeria aurantiellina]
MFQKASSLGSPADRRRYLQDIEATKKEMPIEECIYLTEPYRIATMIPPLPYPLEESPLFPVPQMHLDKNPDLFDHVALLLKQHDINYTAIEARTLLCLGFNPGNMREFVPTVKIFVDVQDDVSTESWPAAVQAVKVLVLSKGLERMEVEILDPNRVFRPVLNLIQRQHSCRAHWESIRDKLIKHIKRFERDTGVIRMLPIESPFGNPETYIICSLVLYETRRNWGALRDRLWDVVGRDGMNKVSFEFRPSTRKPWCVGGDEEDESRIAYGHNLSDRGYHLTTRYTIAPLVDGLTGGK